MGDSIYMYHRTSSAVVESMNAANKEIRERTAVDLVNATILLMRLECKRFTKMKELAWRTDNVFTPRGEMEYNETFEGIPYRDFNLTIEEKEDHYEVATSRRCKPNKMFYVMIPKEATKGSYFGRCSCGVDTRDAVPCEHMAAIVTSTRIPVLTRTNIMPHWWTRSTWQLQFPIEEEPVCTVKLAEIKSSKNRNNFIRYCPLWSAPNKAGRPKKGERRKSGLEAAMGKKREVKRHKLRLYCQICAKHNHTAKDCWKDPINAHKRPDSWKDEEELIAEIGIGANAFVSDIGIGADELVGNDNDDGLVGCA
jgi:hypothetical protein